MSIEMFMIFLSTMAILTAAFIIYDKITHRTIYMKRENKKDIQATVRVHISRSISKTATVHLLIDDIEYVVYDEDSEEP